MVMNRSIVIEGKVFLGIAGEQKDSEASQLAQGGEDPAEEDHQQHGCNQEEDAQPQGIR